MIYFDKLLQTKHDVSMDKQNATKITIRLDSFAKDISINNFVLTTNALHYCNFYKN